MLVSEPTPTKPRNYADGEIELILAHPMVWDGVKRNHIRLPFAEYEGFVKEKQGLKAVLKRGRKGPKGYLFFPWTNILAMRHIFNSKEAVEMLQGEAQRFKQNSERYEQRKREFYQSSPPILMDDDPKFDPHPEDEMDPQLEEDLRWWEKGTPIVPAPHVTLGLPLEEPKVEREWDVDEKLPSHETAADHYIESEDSDEARMD